jgi:hypothetical protein
MHRIMMLPATAGGWRSVSWRQSMSNRKRLREERKSVFNQPPSLEDADRAGYGGEPLPNLPSTPYVDPKIIIADLQSEIEILKTQQGASPTALIPGADGSRMLGRFRLTRNALVIPDDVTKDEMIIMGDLLRQMYGGQQFWMGDYANKFHDGYGEMYVHLAEYFGIEESTLRNWAWVCRKINLSLRRDNLSFSLHYEVAGLPKILKGREAELLQYAADHNLSHRDFKAYLKKLLPRKVNKTPAATRLFDKDQMPSIADLRAIYKEARTGDKRAKAQARKQIEKHMEWLRAIAQSLELEESD